jgi:ribokinase
MPYDVCVYGTICLDRIRLVHHLPKPGGYASIRQERLAPGGEGLNTAIALATWGAKVAMVGNALGKDPEADLLIRLLDHYSPLDSHVIHRRPDVHTPVCDVYITPDGERTMFGTGFSEMSVDAVPDEYLKGTLAFTADGNPGEAAITACEKAHEMGVPIVAMDLHYSERACRHADICLTSYEQVGHHDDLTVLSQIASEMRERFGCTVILTAGAKGCVLAERDQPEVEPISAYTAPQIVDTTGSGDVFRAGLIFARYVQGKPLREAIHFGSAAAALKIGALGACAGIASAPQIERFQTENA